MTMIGKEVRVEGAVQGPDPSRRPFPSQDEVAHPEMKMQPVCSFGAILS